MPSVTPPTPPKTLDGLLAVEEASFLSTAYLWILGRPVDPSGFRDYDARLRSGAPRLQIVAELHASPEGRAHGADLPGLAEAMSRFRLPEPQSQRPLSARALFRLPDAPFVDAAWLAVRGALPTRDQRQRAVARLSAGLPKITYIAEIAPSTQRPASDDIEGLADVIATSRSGLTPIALDIEDLLSFEDEAFVDCAYKTLMRRRPDAVGLAHYTGLLRTGRSKLDVLVRLGRSPEARAVRPEIPGLRSALRRYIAGRLPFIGPVLRHLWPSDGESSHERRLRSLENRIVRMQTDLARQRLDAELAMEEVDRLLDTPPAPNGKAD